MIRKKQSIENSLLLFYVLPAEQPPATRHPPPATCHPSTVEKTCRRVFPSPSSIFPQYEFSQWLCPAVSRLRLAHAWPPSWQRKRRRRALDSWSLRILGLFFHFWEILSIIKRGRVLGEEGKLLAYSKIGKQIALLALISAISVHHVSSESTTRFLFLLLIFLYVWPLLL